MDYYKKLTFRILKENHRDLKTYLASIEMSMQEFVNLAIKEKIDRDYYKS